MLPFQVRPIAFVARVFQHERLADRDGAAEALGGVGVPTDAREEVSDEVVGAPQTGPMSRFIRGVPGELFGEREGPAVGLQRLGVPVQDLMGAGERQGRLPEQAPTIARRPGPRLGLKEGDNPLIPIVTPRPARRDRTLTEHERVANRFIARYRIVVEHTIAPLNRYTVLRRVNRGSRADHTRVVRVVAGLVNRRIEVVPLKTYETAA